MPEIVELNIGHFLIGEAVFTGLAASIKTMRAAMDRGRAKATAELSHERRMILGLGSDITDARRIAKVIERHGERFLTRVFTDIERAKADRRKNRAETYAKRFAAKEACAKALGTGIRHGVWWRDMGVVNMPSGRPTMQLTGGARKRLDALTPKGHQAQIDITITDEGPMAVAFVVISAVPDEKSRASSRPPLSRGGGPSAKLLRHLAGPENALRYSRRPRGFVARQALNGRPPFRNNTLKSWMKFNLGATRATPARLIAPDRPSRYKAAGRLPGTRGR